MGAVFCITARIFQLTSSLNIYFRLPQHTKNFARLCLNRAEANWARSSCLLFSVALRFLVIFDSDICIYVISAFDTFSPLRNRNSPGLTPHYTHNMGFHVQWVTCLYKTTDRPLDQWYRTIAIPSCSPWKPIVSSQLGNAKGGVWIEVARRDRWFAGWPEPESAGDEPTTTVSTRLCAVSHWGILGDLTECFIHCFALARHQGRPGRRILLRRHRLVCSIISF